MKAIKSDSGFLVYQKIFRQMISNQSLIVIWQVLSSGERRVSESCLNSFHLESGLMHFDNLLSKDFNEKLPLYFYSEDGQFIFKSVMSELSQSALTVAFPQEIKLLEESEVNLIRGEIGIDLSDVWKVKRLTDLPDDVSEGVMKVKSMAERSSRDQEFLNNEFNAITLDEEEKLFADKRESPRARPKLDRWVKVKVVGSEEIHFVRLFDLSRGGIGFITAESHLFPKGSGLMLIGLEEFDLDDPILGKIMSQRPIDDSMAEYKIGVKFDSGQD